MKYLVALLLIVAQTQLIGQNNKSKTNLIVKSGQTFQNNKLIFSYQNDKKGNMIFAENDGRNGPITMLFVSDYDSLNRRKRSYSAHSNIGFSINETVYEANQIKNYEFFTDDSVSTNSFERDSLNKINSRDEFLNLKVIKDLAKGKKRLSHIEVLDSVKNVICEYSISEKGDTTTINTHRYNSKNKEVFFHYGKINSEFWTWDIYYDYDANSNLLKSYRIASEDGVKDTTEVRNYKYNSKNLLISENYYYLRKFSSKTDYIYDKQDRIVETHFYEGDESKIITYHYYKYNKNGELLKNITKDYHNSKRGKKEVYTYKEIYWKPDE